MEKTVAVIGGMNFDVHAHVSTMVWRDSNPGTVQSSMGGVGRNIAENLARLDVKVTLFSLIGDDLFGQAVLQDTHAAGVNVTHVEQVKDQSTGVYVSLSDDDDMVVAINDTMVTEAMDVPWAMRHIEVLKQFDILCLDAGLIQSTIDYIASACQDKVIILDPVSVSKARRLVNALPYCQMIKPNRYELQALSGYPAKTLEDDILAAKLLIDRGCRNVVVSRGKDDVIVVRQSGIKHYPVNVVPVVNMAGAGDAFVAGYVAGLVHQAPDPVVWAMRASAIAIASAQTVSPFMSLSTIRKEDA